MGYLWGFSFILLCIFWLSTLLRSCFSTFICRLSISSPKWIRCESIILPKISSQGKRGERSKQNEVSVGEKASLELKVDGFILSQAQSCNNFSPYPVLHQSKYCFLLHLDCRAARQTSHNRAVWCYYEVKVWTVGWRFWKDGNLKVFILAFTASLTQLSLLSYCVPGSEGAGSVGFLMKKQTGLSPRGQREPPLKVTKMSIAIEFIIAQVENPPIDQLVAKWMHQLCYICTVAYHKYSCGKEGTRAHVSTWVQASSSSILECYIVNKKLKMVKQYCIYIRIRSKK